jgi:hypothetical protein
MRVNLLSVLIFVVATICIAQSTKDDVWGYVDGVVVDGDGKPLSGAIITAYCHTQRLTPDGKAWIRPVTQYLADEEGRFNNLKFPEGEVWLLAHKDSEGYPYAFFAFYLMPGQEFPTVKIKAGETTKGVVLRVGVKAAHIKYEAIDADDGKSVSGGFTLQRLDQLPYQTSEPPNRDLLVPPAPFRMTFDGAKGYKPWHYGGDNWQGKEGIISLKSGEVLNLTIRLERAD